MICESTIIIIILATVGMGRLKRRRRDVVDTEQTQTRDEDLPEAKGGSSKSRRKRARDKKKLCEKAKQRRLSKRTRAMASKESVVGGAHVDMRLHSTHSWINIGCGTDSLTPRHCYDQTAEYCVQGDARVVSSWLNELSWYVHGSTKVCNEQYSEQQKSITAALRKLHEVKTCLWRAAACASNDKSHPEVIFVKARRACNPFEFLGEGQSGGLNTIFLNRSAIKLANIDALLDFSLVTAFPTAGVAETLPSSRPSLLRSSSPGRSPRFIFVDLCGSPGGWSEYIMHRCALEDISCKGYGMSLVGKNEHGKGLDWKLGTGANFQICKGVDGTGDIYEWKNVRHMRDFVAQDLKRNTSGGGLANLVVADGGFDAQRNSATQEALAQKVVVCQSAAGLYLLKPGGFLVLKMFGFQTIVTRRVVHYLAQAFESLTVLKPVSSRPASAERYLICKSFCFSEENMELWDGKRWISSMLEVTRDPELQNSLHGSSLLNYYLNSVDLDLCRLNTEACARILSYLERMNGSTENESRVEPDMSPRKWLVECIDRFRQIWKL